MLSVRWQPTWQGPSTGNEATRGRMGMIQTMVAVNPSAAHARELQKGALAGAETLVGEGAGGQAGGRGFAQALAGAGMEPDGEADGEKEAAGDADQRQLESLPPPVAAGGHLQTSVASVMQALSIRPATAAGPVEEASLEGATGWLPRADVARARSDGTKHGELPSVQDVPAGRGVASGAGAVLSGQTAGVMQPRAAIRAAQGGPAEPEVASSAVAATLPAHLHAGMTRAASPAHGTLTSTAPPGTPNAPATTVAESPAVDPDPVVSGSDAPEPAPTSRGAAVAVGITQDVTPPAQAAEPATLSSAAGVPAGGAAGATSMTAATSPAGPGLATGAPLRLDGAAPHLELAATVRSMVEGGRTVARIEVTPADLGPLSIEIERGTDRLTIAVQAAHPAARDLLDAVLPRLRESLGAEGFGEVRATVGDDSRHEARQQGAREDGARDTGRLPGQPDESDPLRTDKRDRLSDGAASDPQSRGAGDDDVAGASDARLREFELDVAGAAVGAAGLPALIDRWA